MQALDPLEPTREGPGAIRVPALVVLAGSGAALVSVLLAALAGGPYLTAADVNGWIVVFAAALFAALFAAPFAIERLQRSRQPDREPSWESALLAWGVVALATGALGLLLAIGGDFSGDSLGAAVGLIAAIESLLVVGTLLVWLVSS